MKPRSHGTYHEYWKHKCRCVLCIAAAKLNGLEYAKSKMDLVRKAKSKPCSDCGIEYPSYVMQFDHTWGPEKKFAVNTWSASRHSRSALESEIAKCEAVCANCHFIRTQKRLRLEHFVSPTILNYNLQFGKWSKTLPLAA